MYNFYKGYSSWHFMPGVYAWALIDFKERF